MTTAEIYPNWLSFGRTEAKEKAVPVASDYALAQNAAKGDMSAFEELYKRHHRRVYSLCLRMTQNVSEAEDGIRDRNVTGVQTCALPIFAPNA